MAPATPTSSASRAPKASRPLCAYSPRWLSGPTPAYEGLVATGPSGVDDEPALGER